MKLFLIVFLLKFLEIKADLEALERINEMDLTEAVEVDINDLKS